MTARHLRNHQIVMKEEVMLEAKAAARGVSFGDIPGVERCCGLET